MIKKRGKKAVLVIEDDAESRNFMARVLELEGYQVLQADNSEQGIAVARENHLALVLLDLQLPGHDGGVVLVEVRNTPSLSTIPVIVITASAAALQRERALGMGATEYLVKPLSAASLREAVARILSRQRGSWNEVKEGTYSGSG